jgi:hypothetical protein
MENLFTNSEAKLTIKTRERQLYMEFTIHCWGKEYDNVKYSRGRVHRQLNAASLPVPTPSMFYIIIIILRNIHIIMSIQIGV